MSARRNFMTTETGCARWMSVCPILVTVCTKQFVCRSGRATICVNAMLAITMMAKAIARKIHVCQICAPQKTRHVALTAKEATIVTRQNVSTTILAPTM